MIGRINEYNPDYAIHPGEILNETLDARGIPTLHPTAFDKYFRNGGMRNFVHFNHLFAYFYFINYNRQSEYNGGDYI